LWDEAETAYGWWQDHGEPHREQWIVTVDPKGQRVEFGPTETATADPDAGAMIEVMGSDQG